MTEKVWEQTDITCTSHKLGARIENKIDKISVSMKDFFICV